MTITNKATSVASPESLCLASGDNSTNMKSLSQLCFDPLAISYSKSSSETNSVKSNICNTANSGILAVDYYTHLTFSDKSQRQYNLHITDISLSLKYTACTICVHSLSTFNFRTSTVCVDRFTLPHAHKLNIWPSQCET